MIYYLTDSDGACALNLTKLARPGAFVYTMHLPHVIVGDLNMTPEQLVATKVVLPRATVSTCSSGGRTIDFAVISPVLGRNVELTIDLEAPCCTPHSSLCLKLDLSTSHVTMTTQSRPPAMLGSLKRTSRLCLQTTSGVELSQSSRIVPDISCRVLC